MHNLSSVEELLIHWVPFEEFGRGSADLDDLLEWFDDPETQRKLDSFTRLVETRIRTRGNGGDTRLPDDRPKPASPEFKRRQ